jgi:Dolichyl-phosphate-mannose-protein mannosyltransferase
MRWRSLLGRLEILTRRIEIDRRLIWRLIHDHLEAVMLGLGFLLRVAVYLRDRTFWMDEGSLFANLKGKPILDFSQPLTGDQLAPFGFLIAERVLLSVLGTSRYVARFVPLACGIAALFLFARLVRVVLPRRAALVALALFACSDDLIYFSSELKPYSVDLAVGLALSLAVFDALGKPIRGRHVAVLAVGVAVAPWCSFPSVFVVVACGATLILTTLRSGRYRDAAVWGTIGIGWLASFLVCFRASNSLLSPYTTMYKFWDFAFLPLEPLSRDSLSKACGILLEIFVNPLNLVAPIWPWAGVILPVSLMLLGVVSLARRSTAAWAILVLPIALAMVASALKRYPLHGRLILELVPAFLLLIAEGTEVVHRMDSGRTRLGYKAVLVLLLAFPCLAALYWAVENHPRDFNQHGDLQYNIFMK